MGRQLLNWWAQITKLLVMGFGLCTVPLLSKTIILSDADDTLFETRDHLGGSFRTNFVLFRIDQNANTLIEIPDTPKEVLVTPKDLHDMRAYLGTESGALGTINKTITLQSGEKIKPGFYRLRNPESYRFFRTTPKEETEGYLLQNFKEAEARDSSGGWKGPYWEYMVKILGHEASAHIFGILTARGHSTDEWKELFEYWVSKNYIEEVPDLNLVHGVTLPLYEAFEINPEIAVRKAKVLEEIALALGKVKFKESDLRLHPNGKDEGEFHYLVFVDDNQANIDAALSVFIKLAQDKTVPVKFGVFNMGLRSEITQRKQPQFAIVEPGGTLRQATEEEKYGEINLLLDRPIQCADRVAEEK